MMFSTTSVTGVPTQHPPPPQTCYLSDYCVYQYHRWRAANEGGRRISSVFKLWHEGHATSFWLRQYTHSFTYPPSALVVSARTTIQLPFKLITLHKAPAGKQQQVDSHKWDCLLNIGLWFIGSFWYLSCFFTHSRWQPECVLKAALNRGNGRWLRCADGGRYHLRLAHGWHMYVYERV